MNFELQEVGQRDWRWLVWVWIWSGVKVVGVGGWEGVRTAVGGISRCVKGRVIWGVARGINID